MSQTMIADARIDRFRTYLRNFMDDDGLVLGEVNADGPRPWRDEDFDGYEKWELYQDDYPGFVHYEDTIMTTSRLLRVELMHKLLSPEDESSIAYAERATLGLLAVARAGSRVERGYLPKPHGGLRNAEKSVGISSDQYEHAILALWAAHQQTNKPAIRAAIEETLVGFADYMQRHDYSYNAFGRYFGTPENGPHLGGMNVPLGTIATKITGESHYEQRAWDRFWPLLKPRWLEGPDLRRRLHPNMANLLILGYVFAGLHGCHREECERFVSTMATVTRRSLSADGLAYNYDEVSDDHRIEPHYIAGEAPLNYRILNWRSNDKGADSCKVVHSLAAARILLDEDAYLQDIDRVLARFQKPQDFLRHYDADQLPQEFAYMKMFLCNQFVGAWIEAYFLRHHPDILHRLYLPHA